MKKKILVAVRLPESVVFTLKELAIQEGFSQAEIIAEGIGLFKLKQLYSKGKSEEQKPLSYT